jgi:hypothetical protein
MGGTFAALLAGKVSLSGRLPIPVSQKSVPFPTIEQIAVARNLKGS